MARDKPNNDGRLTTIKVRDNLRRWLKVEAASRGIPMYELLDKLIAKSQRGRPWEARARS